MSSLCKRRLCPRCCHTHDTPCGNATHYNGYLKLKEAHEAAAFARQQTQPGSRQPSHPKPVVPPIDPAPAANPTPMPAIEPAPAATPAVAANIEPFVNPGSAPTPAQTPMPTDSTAGTSTAQERYFKVNMEPPFKGSWDRAAGESRSRLEAIDQKRANQRALTQTVILACWLTVSAHPFIATVVVNTPHPDRTALLYLSIPCKVSRRGRPSTSRRCRLTWRR